MKLICFVPLLLCAHAVVAQVNIMVEDNTGSGFILGVNGFVQNTAPTQSILIKKLDTIPHRLTVELDSSVWISKIVHLRQGGTYKYIVTTNSRDELQLRYRGTTTAPPPGLLTMDVQRVLPVRVSQPVVTASVQSADTLSIEKTNTAPIAQVVPTKEITEVKLLLPPTIKNSDENSVDTVGIVQITPPRKGADSLPNPFVSFFSNLEKTEFEFDKLKLSEEYAKKHSFTADQLRQVFGSMSYDASRLQLLRTIRLTKKNLAEYKDLAPSFDYEISKQQFENLITP